jgi:hypothetical protein
MRIGQAALLGLASALSGCNGARYPGEETVTVVSLAQIDCSDCGDRIAADLRLRPGVYRATFHRGRAEIEVVASPSFDVLTEAKRLAAERGFEALLGAGRGRYIAGRTFPEGADVTLVARNGEDIPDIGAILGKGKLNVVEFSATWCRPCRAVDDHMAGLLSARRDIAYRRLEIGDWDTPLARRYLRDVPRLPYVIVFDAEGRPVRAVAGLDLPALDRAIEKATKR